MIRTTDSCVEEAFEAALEPLAPQLWRSLVVGEKRTTPPALLELRTA